MTILAEASTSAVAANEEAKALVKSGTGLRIMDDIRDEIRSVVDYEEKKIKLRDDQNRIDTGRIHVTTILAGGGGLLLTILLLATLGRYIELQGRSDKS